MKVDSLKCWSTFLFNLSPSISWKIYNIQTYTTNRPVYKDIICRCTNVGTIDRHINNKQLDRKRLRKRVWEREGEGDGSKDR